MLYILEKEKINCNYLNNDRVQSQIKTQKGKNGVFLSCTHLVAYKYSDADHVCQSRLIKFVISGYPV